MKLYNLARMTVSGTPGTGDITLLAAATGGYITFNQALVPNGAKVSYGVKDGNNLEVGRATYNSTGAGSLTGREPRITSAGNQTALSLTSAAVVSIVALAEDFEESLSPIAQLLGNSNAIAQVEAGSKAIRLRPMPPSLREAYIISRHCVGLAGTWSATTGAANQVPIFSAAMAYSGFMALNKFQLSGLCTTGLTGARVGTMKLQLRKGNFAATPIGDLNVGSGGTNLPALFAGKSQQSLFGKQNPPLLVAAISTNAGNNAGSSDEGMIYEISAGVKSTPIGDQNIGNVTMFDAWENSQYRPLMCLPGHGVLLFLTCPAAVTNQQLDFSVNMTWDEWLPFPDLPF